jgi:hypothetical protein
MNDAIITGAVQKISSPRGQYMNKPASMARQPENTLEHLIRNWLLVQRYRLVIRYRVPSRLTILFLLGLEKTLTTLRILN